MKKTYITPDISVENSEGLLLMAQSKGVRGIMDDSLGIDYGGVDEDAVSPPLSMDMAPGIVIPGTNYKKFSFK